MTKIRTAFFYTVVMTPMAAILCSILYLCFFTNLPQLLYIQSIRNVYFECMAFADEDYVYKMKPGPCKLENLEFSTVLHHDKLGFRNSGRDPGSMIAVLGDSNAHGFGVDDDQSFASVLDSKFKMPTYNFAVGSYATMRELEVLKQYGRRAQYVVIQYCDNDAEENAESLRDSKEEFRKKARASWTGIIDSYNAGKALGLRKVLADLGAMLWTGAYKNRREWQEGIRKGRDIKGEAKQFALIVSNYRAELEGKRLIVFESSTWALNAPSLQAEFSTALREHAPWLDFRVLDAYSFLSPDEYFFLDGHPKPVAHLKTAEQIYRTIESWKPMSTSR